jgi:hypothetical protein
MSTERDCGCESRRHFLATNAMGIGGVALAWLLKQEGLLAQDKPDFEKPRFNLLPKPPHAAPKAKAMISMFMQGGPSHLDLFDPKPELAKHDGTTFGGDIKYDNAAESSPTLMASPWKFERRGKCGMEISELLPHLGTVADDITLIRSMRTGVNNHGQSIQALNTGKIQEGRPALGSWLTYGLGSEAQNLPAFVVLTDPGGVPVLGVKNWANGWLPSLYQGTVVRPREPRILNLDPPPELKGAPQENYLDYLRNINRRHLEERPGESDLEARIEGYELAAAMQLAAKEALQIDGESDATKKLYGLDDPACREFGTRCLIARRMVERGVRFVQVFTRNQYWDHHGNIRKSLPASCKFIDQPAAALVKDLKARGLLDSTVVHWGGEMGRLPVIQKPVRGGEVGRDHNTYGFSMWVAGGGFAGGRVHGETDELGHRAVKDVVSHNDYHATLLHLFGLDPTKLSFKVNGLPHSLVDGQPARVVREILA